MKRFRCVSLVYMVRTIYFRKYLRLADMCMSCKEDCPMEFLLLTQSKFFHLQVKEHFPTISP